MSSLFLNLNVYIRANFFLQMPLRSLLSSFIHDYDLKKNRERISIVYRWGSLVASKGCGQQFQASCLPCSSPSFLPTSWGTVAEAEKENIKLGSPVLILVSKLCSFSRKSSLSVIQVPEYPEHKVLTNHSFICGINLQHPLQV